jgi:hypothetical protein
MLAIHCFVLQAGLQSGLLGQFQTDPLPSKLIQPGDSFWFVGNTEVSTRFHETSVLPITRTE